MIGKLVIAIVLFCGVALAQPPQGGPEAGGPGFGGPHQNFEGPRQGGEFRPLLPPGRWWKNAEVAKTIGLNDMQIQKIEQIFQENRVKLVDVHASLQKEEFKLEPLLEADNPDEGAVLSAIDRIAATRATLEKTNAQMAFAIRRVLTPDQWKKLRSLRPSREHFPPPMGGPHGMGPHGDAHNDRHSVPPPPPDAPASPDQDKAQQPEPSK